MTEPKQHPNDRQPLDIVPDEPIDGPILNRGAAEQTELEPVATDDVEVHEAIEREQVEEAAVQQTTVDAAQGAPSGLGGDEPTVGMGTSLAIGCIAGTIFLIIVALIVLAVQALM